MADMELTCLCGEKFIFTEGEQQFFAERGYTPPKRCKKCRAEKKRQRQDEERNY